MIVIKQIRSLSAVTSKCALISRKFSYNLTNFQLSNTFNNSNINLFWGRRGLSAAKPQISNDTIKISEAFLHLDNNYKQQLRIKKSDIEQLISCINNEDIINEDNYLLLLQCCGHLIPDEIPSTKIALAQETWQKLLQNKIKLTTEHYNALLQSYVENKIPLNHREFLSNMVCEPNVQTYDLLLECVSESGDVNQAIEVVNLMKDKGYSANEPVFSSLILCHLRNGDLKNAQNILATMRIAHMTPSSCTYTALLRGYVENNNVDLFLNTLDSCQTREFNLKQLISILQSVCLSGNLELLTSIKKIWATKFDSRIFEIKLNNLCVNLIYLNKPLVAYKLFKTLIDPEVGFVTESDTYASFLLYELIKSNTSAEIIIQIADDLIKTNKNMYALFKATELSLKNQNVNLSLSLLQALNERKQIIKNHYFWPILVQQAKNFGEKGIFEIFNEMQQMNIQIETDTLEVYSLQYIRNMDPDVLINKLKQFNLTVTDVLSPISVVLLRSGKTKQVADLTSKYKVKLDGSRIIKQLVSTFVASNDLKSIIVILKNIQLKNTSEDWAGQLVFFTFTRSGSNINYNQILRLLKAYKHENIKISVPFTDKIDNLTKKIKDADLKSNILKTLHDLDPSSNLLEQNHIPHPRNMVLDELECHLIELRDKQMETRGILRKLIQMHCRFGNLVRVSQLCEEFKSAGYNLSAGMKSSLLDLFLKNGQLENALKMYRDIKESHISFTIDDYKLVDLAKLLCSENKIHEAEMLLKDGKSIQGGLKIEPNCWRLLDLVAKSGKLKETQLLFNTLIDCGYCKESNVILGPLIRVHICNNNKAEAVEEFINCCTKYKKTPLLHELMCYLVKNESSSELIQQVVESSVQIHGAAQTQTTLAAALAETGLTKTLRKLFLESNLYLSQKLLQQYCERWIKDNKIHALKNLINGARGITSIDLNIVYFNLMKVYSSENDSESALNLWGEMQEKNIFPNEEIQDLVDELVNKT